MPVRLQGQFLLVGAAGTILSFLLIFLIPGPDGLTGPESIPTNVVSPLTKGLGLMLVAFYALVIVLVVLPSARQMYGWFTSYRNKKWMIFTHVPVCV